MLNSIVHNIDLIYIKTYKEKLYLGNFDNLHKFLKELVDTSFKHDMTEVLEDIIQLIARNIKNQLLYNCPEEKDVGLIFNYSSKKTERFGEPKGEDILQWKAISQNYPDLLISIFAKAIYNKKYGIIDKSSNSIQFLIMEIVSKEFNLEDNLKGNITSYIQGWKNYYAIGGMKHTDIKIDSSKIKQIDGTIVRVLLKNESPFAKRLILTHYEFLRDSFEIGKLDDLTSLSILGSFGNISCKDYDSNEFAKELFRYNFKNIKWFRKKFQKNLKTNYKHYEQLKYGLESIRMYVNSDIETDKESLIKKIDKELKKFKNTKKFHEYTDLKWP